MKSCTSHAWQNRLLAQPQNVAPAFRRRTAAVNVHSFPVATVALAVVLLAAAPESARAANECGADGAGNDAVTCSAASYATGISYAGSNGLTINLANPGMVITGTQGVSLQSIIGPVNPELTVNVTNVQSITTSGSAVTVNNTATGGLASVNINGGTLTSTGTLNTVSASAGASSSRGAQVTLTGGQVLNTGTGGGISVATAGVSGTGNAAVVITGGTVQTVSTGVMATVSGPNHTGTASITMSGGSVLSSSGIALWARQTGKGVAQVEMTGGTVVAANAAVGDGIFASANTGTFAVDVSGGTVTGGGGFGNGVHTSGIAGGTIKIGTGAVINAGGSGVAIRDGDANRDGIDEIGGNVAITTAGLVNGAILLGGGTDTVSVTGGTINGNITGDGADGLSFNLGANSFTHGAAYAISGMDSIVMNSGNAQLDGSVAANTLNVKGGTLVLGGSAAIAGLTSVEGGTLAVNGTLNGSVNVLALGRLQGSGTVGSTTVAGTIAPGNSIGTLSINGNFAQSSGSTYLAEVDPASSASDLIRVSGAASVGSGSKLQVVRSGSAAYSLGTRYTVLSADGGITGTYSLTGDTQSAFVRLADSYDANHVYLTAEKVRAFVEAGGTPNQAAVGAALDTMSNNNSLVTAMAWLPNDLAARDALNQLSADIYASSKTAALEDSRFVREAAIDRLRSAACAPGSVKPTSALQQSQAGCTPEDGQARAGWAQVFGAWGRIDSDGNAAKLKRDIGGFMAGFDTGIGSGWRVGAFGGYSRASADTSSHNSSSKTDSYHLGVYGGTQWGATALRLGASQSWNRNDTHRSVAFAGFAGSMAGKYDSTTSQVFGEVGRRIDLGGTSLEPFAGLAHVRLRSDAFLEQGGAAALYGLGGSVETTFSTIGLRAGMQLSDSTRLRGVLGWRHAFGDTAPKSTLAFADSLPFMLAGVPLAKNVAVLEAGMETLLRPNLSLNASYSGQFGNGLQDHGFKVSLNWSF